LQVNNIYIKTALFLDKNVYLFIKTVGNKIINLILVNFLIILYCLLKKALIK